MSPLETRLVTDFLGLYPAAVVDNSICMRSDVFAGSSASRAQAWPVQPRPQNDRKGSISTDGGGLTTCDVETPPPGSNDSAGASQINFF